MDLANQKFNKLCQEIQDGDGVGDQILPIFEDGVMRFHGEAVELMQSGMRMVAENGMAR